MGEFGRTPKINKDAGRDHWGPAASLLFAGAGVQAGPGASAPTDKQGAYVTRRPVAPGRRGLHRSTTRSASTRASSSSTPDGRPVEILDEGETISELYS